MNSKTLPKVSEMSDCAVARDIIDDTFDLTRGRRSLVIGLTIAALKRVERALDPDVLRQRQRQWTERRVRSIVDLEARRIDAYELSDLERVRLQEAKLEYQRSTARAARVAAFLAHRDPASHGPEIDAQVALARGLAGAGNPAAASRSTDDRAGSDGRGELARGVGRARIGGAGR